MFSLRIAAWSKQVSSSFRSCESSTSSAVMSLQVATDPGSLMSLRISVGDVANFYSIARRVGNWLTAASGDRILLSSLDQDDLDIIRCRSHGHTTIQQDMGSCMTLLANGDPMFFVGNDAEKNLERFRRFTVLMVCEFCAEKSLVELITGLGVERRCSGFPIH